MTRQVESRDLKFSNYRMPDGMEVIGFRGSLAELRFIHHEIFVQRVYGSHGIEIRNGDCVFDVGANVGLFTLFAASQASKLTVLAFEPSPPTYAALQANVDAVLKMRGDQGHTIKLFEHALSDDERIAEISWYPEMPGNSTLFPTEKKAEASVVSEAFRMQDAWKFDKLAFTGLLLLYPIRHWLIRTILTRRFRRGQTFPVQLRRLSTIISEQNIKSIDLLKIDVEGAEFDVLNGLSDSDWDRIRQLVMEISPANDHRVSGLLDQLKQRGFNQVTIAEMPGRDQPGDTVTPEHPRATLPKSLYAIR